jgi:hypothetical protein
MAGKFLSTAVLMLGVLTVRGSAQRALPADETPQPEIIGEGVISTPDDEFGGSFSADGNTIYFDKTVSAHYLYTLCESHFAGGEWSRPEIMRFSGQYRDSDPVLSPDGKTLLFCIRPAACRQRREELLHLGIEKNGARLERSAAVKGIGE